VTEEFVPGFRNSSASYTISLLHPVVIRDLRLVERGLRIVERPFANFVPLEDGRSLRFGGEAVQRAGALSAGNLAHLSPKDAERLPAHHARLQRLADVLRRWVLRTPPELGGPWVLADWRSARTTARLLLEFGKLGLPGQRD